MSAPTGILKEILDSVDTETASLIYGHLAGGTSAVWLSTTLTEAGFKISPTTLKEQRARILDD